MAGYVRIDDDVFEQLYSPLRSETGGWRDFLWSEADDADAIACAASEHRLWTTVDADGFILLCSGRHLVNRHSYVITEYPVRDGLVVEVYDEEDLDDWNEHLKELEELEALDEVQP